VGLLDTVFQRNYAQRRGAAAPAVCWGHVQRRAAAAPAVCWGRTVYNGEDGGEQQAQHVLFATNTDSPVLLLFIAAAETFNNTEPYETVDPGLCKDYDPRCADWAKNGECTKNAKFMVSVLPSHVHWHQKPVLLVVHRYREVEAISKSESSWFDNSESKGIILVLSNL
jgi:hypothetical protein